MVEERKKSRKKSYEKWGSFILSLLSLLSYWEEFYCSRVIWDLMGNELNAEAWSFSLHIPKPNPQWVGCSSFCYVHQGILGKGTNVHGTASQTYDADFNLKRTVKSSHWITVKVSSSVPDTPVSSCTMACWYLSCWQQEKNCFVTAATCSVSSQKPMHGRVKGG